MPLYTPKASETEFVSGKNILASENTQMIEAGATLDHTTFETGQNDVGLQIARNADTGKYEDVGGVEDLDGFDDFGILNVNYNNDGENDVIAGEVIIRGSVYEAKLVDEVTDAFREATPMIRYVVEK